MTLRIPAALIAPDLRFLLRHALSAPGTVIRISDLLIRAEGSLPREVAVSPYLRYADRDTVILAEGMSGRGDFAGRLAAQVQTIAASGQFDDLGTAVLALDAVDQCFRESCLWPGNIYLAGAQSLTAVLELVRHAEPADRPPEVVSRELAALELAYLFPIASRFRAGIYDGRVQFRLNGWGRSLAARFTTTPFGAERLAAFKHLVGVHLAAEFRQYESFLNRLDFARQSYYGNILDQALSLPIPVLI